MFLSMRADHFIGGSFHSENNDFVALSTSVYNLSTVSFAQKELAVMNWWPIPLSELEIFIIVAVKWGPLFRTIQVMPLNAAIAYAKPFVAASQSGWGYGNSQLYTLRSSFKTNAYLRTSLSLLPTYRKSI